MTPLPIIEPRTFKSCGECTACCTALAVDEIDKGEFEQCEHDCGTHCGIYEKRPQSCRGYQCLWTAMEDDVDDAFRPDRLGIILELQHSTIGPAVTVRELEVGIMDDDNSIAFQFAMAVAKSVNAFIIVFQPGKQRRSIFPPWASDMARKARVIIEGYKGDREPVETRVVHRALASKPSPPKQHDKGKDKRRKQMAKKSKKRNRK